jgi:monofunctional biosynthetic peptidoglycan transglycosylase
MSLQQPTRTLAKPSAAAKASPRPLWRWLRLVLMIVIVVLLIPYVLVPIYRFVDPGSTLMMWRRITGHRVERTLVPIERIDPNLVRSVIASEDASFCTHHGIDLRQMREAVRSIGTKGERGGSTLTQQLAKNLFLWQGRNPVRKVLEVPLALWIDIVIPKRRQLEIYLNIVEWGPNGEFGAEAAAHRAFGKSAHQLTQQEAALLAAILPNPVRRSAHQPGPGLRRLAGIYMTRASSDKLYSCLKRSQ